MSCMKFSVAVTVRTSERRREPSRRGTQGGNQTRRAREVGDSGARLEEPSPGAVGPNPCAG